MAFDLEEQERIDSLKGWWDRFGNTILTAIIVVMLGILAWYGWNWYQSSQVKQALGYYEIVQTSAVSADADSQARLDQAAAELKKSYGDTAYAARGALLAADFYIRGGHYEQAQQELTWLAGRGNDFPELLPVAKLRLASVYADQKKFDEALAQLNNPPEAFKALYDDRKGDVLIAQGKKQEAVAAWKAALSGKQLPAAFVNTIQLKISALGGE